MAVVAERVITKPVLLYNSWSPMPCFNGRASSVIVSHEWIRWCDKFSRRERLKVYNVGCTCERNFVILAGVTLRASYGKYCCLKKKLFRNTTSLFLHVIWAWKYFLSCSKTRLCSWNVNGNFGSCHPFQSGFKCCLSGVQNAEKEWSASILSQAI